jgi:hypothetical protein
MMSGQPLPLPEPSAWQAQLLRLTAFPVEPAAALAKEWWQEVLGQAPESSTQKKLLRTAEGTIEGKVLTLTLDVQRIDWSFVPLVDPLNPPSAAPALGAFPTALEECSGLFRQFLDRCPAISRLAFGAILLQPTEAHESGYRLLDAYLPSVQVSPSSSDFLYRINRRRPSRSVVAGLQLNRLSTWSVMQWQRQMLAVGEGGVGSLLEPQGGCACRLELDINTDPTFPGPLPMEALIPLWGELVELGQEIAAKGDIP